MVELKKKEAECLEAPQDHGNATSPGVHACVRGGGKGPESGHGQAAHEGFIYAPTCHCLVSSSSISSHSFPFFPFFHIHMWTVNFFSEWILVPLSNSLASLLLVCEGVLIFKNRATPGQLQWSDLSSSITLHLLHSFWKLTSVWHRGLSKAD